VKADKRWNVEEAARLGVNLSEVARGYRISGACSVPLEAGTDAGGTAVRGGRDRGCDPAHRGARIVTLLRRGVKPDLPLEEIRRLLIHPKSSILNANLMALPCTVMISD
jgi:hypothetical protein